MAAPTPTPRTLPTGDKMPDGFKTLVTFLNKPGIQLWEQATGGVTPPGFDVGDGIPTTTMQNILYRTKRAKQLLDVTDASFKCLYDPDVINDILHQIGVEQSVTYRYPDNSTLAVWGFMKTFKPGPLEEGKPPEADVSICHTNWDPTDQVEAGPVFTPAAGT